MKRFSDFAQAPKLLESSKVRIDDVLNVELEVVGFKVKESRYDKNTSGNYLTLQIVMNQEKHIIFTGSEVLLEQLTQYEEQLPFVATIKKIDKYYTLA